MYKHRDNEQLRQRDPESAEGDPGADPLKPDVANLASFSCGIPSTHGLYFAIDN